MVYALFSDGDGILQNDNSQIHTARVVNNLYEEHESELEHIEWLPLSPNLNIFDHLWRVLERQVRNLPIILSKLCIDICIYIYL